ncbi:MAG: thioesterase family protein [Candidatus Omnitrophota bacterium]
MKTKIYYHNTDTGGVVYYAEYLKFLEEARTEFLDEKGVSVKKLIQEGTVFVVARQEIDYKAPAFYGDELEIHARITSMSRAKIEFGYDIKNQKGQNICGAKTIMVCVDKNIKPKPIPPDIRKKLEG